MFSYIDYLWLAWQCNSPSKGGPLQSEKNTMNNYAQVTDVNQDCFRQTGMGGHPTYGWK